MTDFNITTILGFLGAGIVFAAYLPQIYHLLAERCSAGLSIKAFGLWFIASILLLIHAVTIVDPVFIILQSFHAIAIGIILAYTHTFKGGMCASHIAEHSEAVRVAEQQIKQQRNNKPLWKKQ